MYLFETEEHSAIRATARKFAERHIAPHGAEWEENEEIVTTFVAEHPDFERVPAGKVLAQQRIPLECGEEMRLLPHVHDTDGFYAVVDPGGRSVVSFPGLTRDPAQFVGFLAQGRGTRAAVVPAAR